MYRTLAWAVLCCFVFASKAAAEDGNRLTYLDEFCDPYYVHREFPKLTTPQWVGEEGVEAVVIYSIDDLRDTAKYEAYLRPILERLKEVEGTAAVSIMTNWVDADDPMLQQWLTEGVAIDAHTADHPCPCLQGGNFASGKDTYDRCVDRLFEIPHNRPVAFRFPCMDSKNTPSPRMFAEALCRTTEKGHFLQIDSSVDNVFTAADPTLPREMVMESDGSGRFTKYIPFPSFVNKIENYPYPYIISRTMWEIPCTIPDDWQGFNLQQPNNPKTVEDWKASLDATVLKQGTAAFIFHPHGWIRSDQLVDIIDHAVDKHGRKVKFLQFRDCLERLNTNLLSGQPLRTDSGDDNGVRLLDLNSDGYMDVVIGNDQRRQTRVWDPQKDIWHETPFPTQLVSTDEVPVVRARFGILGGDVVCIAADETGRGAWRFRDGAWQDVPQLLAGLAIDDNPLLVAESGVDQGVRLRDINADGNCELLVGSVEKRAIFQWNDQQHSWKRLPFALPKNTEIVFGDGLDAGLRFVDVDEDGFDDVVFSDERRFSLDLFESMEKGWSQDVSNGGRHDKGAIPMISRNGMNNGAWFAKNYLWIQNEDTARLPDGIDRMSFVDMLRPVETKPKTAAASHKAIRVQPGYRVDLAAAEPLVMDPVSFDWGPDGKFWVVEMADYPLGVDGEPGGRVRFLRDTDHDGKYDESTLFLTGLNFPTGVLAWGKGVIVSAAPDIFYAEDTDGDGVADKRQTLYTGFGEGNQQHRVNGFWRGLDNWIYVANGDSGGTIESAKTGKKISISGRDLRIRPDTGELEAVTGQSQYGRATDNWGNWFGCSNSRPVYHFVVEEQYYLRNPQVAAKNPIRWISTVENTPIYPISRVLSHWSGYRAPPAGEPSRFTSANGICIYRDEVFGSAFQNMALVSEPVHNLIHRHQVEKDGVSFQGGRAPGELGEEFLASSDSWFRPAAIRTGPNGGIWVADIYRLVIEHPEWIDDEEEKRIDLRAGHEKGRIYRVLPVNVPTAAVPRFDSLSNAELVEQLASSNSWRRDMAQHLLIDREATEAVAQLETMACSSSEPLARLHALCTLDGLGMLTPEVLTAALKDRHPGVRKHAIRLAEPLLNDAPKLQVAVSELTSDTDMNVRLQLAYSLGQWHDAKSGRLLASLLAANYDQPYLVSAALTSLQDANFLTTYQGVREQVESNPQLVNVLCEVIAVVAGSKSPERIELVAEDLLPSKTTIVSTWRKQAILTLAATIRRGGRSPSKLLGPMTQSRWASLLNAARETLVAEVADADEIRFAANLLAHSQEMGNDDIASMIELLSPHSVPERQRAAFEALASSGSRSFALEAIKGWAGYTPAMREKLLDVLLVRGAWCELLLQEIADNRLATSDLGTAARLRLVEHADKKIAAKAKALFAEVGTSTRAEVLEQYASASPAKGNFERGQELFRKHCSSCHRLEDHGHTVGPDLKGLTNKSPEALRVAVLDPNRAVEDKFLDFAVLTVDGRSFTGMLAAESGVSITLRGQDGKEETILREEIDQLRSTGRSLMPEGFEKVLDPQALADLVRYVGEASPASEP